MKEKIIAQLKLINENIPADTEKNLFEAGLLDSFDMVNLVTGLETEFDIEIEPEDIDLENFQSISAICKLVQKYSD